MQPLSAVREESGEGMTTPLPLRSQYGDSSAAAFDVEAPPTPSTPLTEGSKKLDDFFNQVVGIKVGRTPFPIVRVLVESINS